MLQRRSSKVKYLFAGVAALLLCSACVFASPPVLYSVRPKSGPLSGGSKLHVVGDGLMSSGVDRLRCVFEDSSLGSEVSVMNEILNSSYLICLMPELRFLSSQDLSRGYQVAMAVTTSAGLRSNALSFLVLNLSNMRINGINPDEGINSTQNEVDIFGVGFLNTEEIVCAYGDSEAEIVQVPAMFVNESVLKCMLSAYPSTAQVAINVWMNGQSSSLVVANTVHSNRFTFFATSPVAVLCEFSNSYAAVMITFDREVEIGKERASNTMVVPNCTLLFDTETLALLGSGTQCLWFNSNQRIIVINLVKDSQIFENSTLTFGDGAIRTRYVEFSRLTSGSTYVRLNSELLQPVAIIDAPMFIPYCGNFTVSGLSSQNGGFQGLRYRWSVQRVTENGNATMTDSSFDMYVLSEFDTNPLLVIPAELFSISTHYSIRLEVENFLGLTSDSFILVSPLDLPAPSVSIRGSRERIIATDAELTLEGMVSLTNCPIELTNGLSPSWTIALEMDLDLESSASGQVAIDEVDLGGINTNTIVLTLPPHTLLPYSTYIATLTVTSDTEQTGYALVILTAELSGIQARIDGGIRRAVWAGGNIVLDGRLSDGIRLADTEALTVWNCSDIWSGLESASPCSANVESILNDVESNFSLLLEIEAGTFAPGSYRLTLTITYINQVSSAYQVLDVVSYKLPQVTITPHLRLNSIPVHEKLLLYAIIVSDYSGTVDWVSQNILGKPW